MWPTHPLAKLTSIAAMTRLVQSPIEDVIGKGIDQQPFLSMAQKATGESGLNLKAQAKLVTSGIYARDEKMLLIF